ncbi:hypothetical protein J7I80_04970 [Bacillus sp. ISL-41]|uniref:hypothetical protein n=1 Tax=Bacillus sp. ISL-41 TaxID=2819127 RepID=UPI001BEABFB4|nr:hypothetical protein [Bacillus sp. ISL-41]MBT2641567.1 hypothetical protein [Bacillus sp. ISL-41]
MTEERLERLEGMMSQLITMVGNLHNSMSEMQTVQKEHGKRFEAIEMRMGNMETKMDQMVSKLNPIETKMDQMETKNELRHQEMLNQVKRLEKDQDFIWEKAVRNERELEIMKRTSES